MTKIIKHVKAPFPMATVFLCFSPDEKENNGEDGHPAQGKDSRLWVGVKHLALSLFNILKKYGKKLVLFWFQSSFDHAKVLTLKFYLDSSSTFSLKVFVHKLLN